MCVAKGENMSQQTIVAINNDCWEAIRRDPTAFVAALDQVVRLSRESLPRAVAIPSNNRAATALFLGSGLPHESLNAASTPLRSTAFS